MIRKALSLFLILFVVYTAIIVMVPRLSATQDQNQANSKRAEYYLYMDTVNPPPVIIGTSLSARLVMDSLPEVYNLAFAGLSLLDGLNIVEKREQLPNVIFIESNFYWKKGSANFLDPIFNPVNFYSKKLVPSFRSDKQPITLFTDELIKLVKRAKNKERIDRPVQGFENALPEFQRKVFEDTWQEYSDLPDTVLINDQIEKLEKRINDLKSKGVQIVFFEMPIHPELLKTVGYDFLRKRFWKTFSKQEFEYVPWKEWNFQTTDGIHLAYPEALQYTKYLAKYNRITNRS